MDLYTFICVILCILPIYMTMLFIYTRIVRIEKNIILSKPAALQSFANMLINECERISKPQYELSGLFKLLRNINKNLLEKQYT